MLSYVAAVRRYASICTVVLMGCGLTATAAETRPPSASMTIHADQVVGKVSQYLTGSCLEDIQHEIYPGLYSQMLFGESFQEPPPPEPMAGITAVPRDYGAWYLNADGELGMDELTEPSFLMYDGAELANGATGVEMKILRGSDEWAGMLIKLSEPGNRMHQFNAYCVCFNRDGQMFLRGFGKQDIKSEQLPFKAGFDQWFTLEVRTTGKALGLFIDGKSVFQFDEGQRPAANGKVGLYSAFSKVRFRNWWIDAGAGRKSIALQPQGDNWSTAQLSGMWRGVRSGTATGSFGINKEEPFAGRRCQRMSFTAGAGTIGIENRGLRRAGLCFRAGKPYEGLMWIRTDQQVPLTVALQSADGSRTYASQLLNTAAVSATAEHGWKRLDFTLTPTAEDIAGRFTILLEKPAVVDFGRVFLQPGEWGRYKGLRVRKDMVEKLLEQGVGVIRYGGSMMDVGANKWKRQIGPHDRRPGYDGGGWQWYRYTTQGWGIIDFLDLCEATGILGIPCTNIDETPNDMADFIEYVNGTPDSPWGKRRVADGHAKPYGLRHLELGNEQTINAGYFTKFKPLAEAIWSKDPGIILVVGDMYFQSPFTDPYHVPGSWDKTLAIHEQILRLAKQHGREVWFDEHVSTERWPHPGTDEYPGDLPGLRSLKENLGKLVPGAKYEVVVFEFNSDRHDIGRALCNAWAINVCESLDMQVACSANCFEAHVAPPTDNPFDQGLIFFNPSQVWLQPPGYVGKMVSDNYLPLRVQSSVQSPGGRLGVSAKRSEDGKTLVLQIVNQSDQAMVTDLQLHGFVPIHPHATVSELSGPLDGINPPDQPMAYAPIKSTWPHALTHGQARYTFPGHSFTIIRFE